MQIANINQLNEYGKELFAKAKREPVFIKGENEDFSGVILDYQFFEYLKKLYSPTPKPKKTLYDACMQNNNFGDDDFDDIDFDEFNQVFLPDDVN